MVAILKRLHSLGFVLPDYTSARVSVPKRTDKNVENQPGHNHLYLGLHCNHTSTPSTTSLPSPVHLGRGNPPPLPWWTAQPSGPEAHLCTLELYHLVEAVFVVSEVPAAGE